MIVDWPVNNQIFSGGFPQLTGGGYIDWGNPPSTITPVLNFVSYFSLDDLFNVILVS